MPLVAPSNAFLIIYSPHQQLTSLGEPVYSKWAKKKRARQIAFYEVSVRDDGEGGKWLSKIRSISGREQKKHLAKSVEPLFHEAPLVSFCFFLFNLHGSHAVGIKPSNKN